MSGQETQRSGAAKWRTLGERAVTFHKFAEPGDSIEGLWRGTSTGKYGLNGRLDVDGSDVLFTLSAGLRDLAQVEPGRQVRITFVRWAQSKSGNRFRLFKVEVAS